MSEVSEYIRRVIERSKLTRESFSDQAAPTSFAKIRLIPFFGDLRSEFVFSTLLLPRLFKNDYVIVCSWPGHSGLYSGIGEYWSVDNEAALAELVRHTHRFENTKANQYERLLLRYFDNVTAVDTFISGYYHDGFQQKYLDEFDGVEYHLPALPSVNLTWQDAGTAKHKSRIFLAPAKYITRWGQGQQVSMFTERSFWSELIDELLRRDYFPILMQNYGTYDMSTDFGADCAYITEQNILALLGVMRGCDCALDIFTGLSRLALAARTPYLVCDERQRYFATKDYILDDLCGVGIPKTHLFSFAPFVTTHSATRIVSAIVNRVDDFIPTIDQSVLPPTIESEQILSYGKVRKREVQRIGARFFSPHAG